MDVPRYENSRLHEEYNISDIGNLDQIIFDDHYFEVGWIRCCTTLLVSLQKQTQCISLLIYFESEQMMDSEAGDIPVDWGMPDTSNGVHPIYFAKHMSKVYTNE